MLRLQESKDIEQITDDYFGKTSEFKDERSICWNIVEAAHKKYERLRTGCNDDWSKYVLEYRENNKLPLVANLKCLEGAAVYSQWLMKEAYYCRNRSLIQDE